MDFRDLYLTQHARAHSATMAGGSPSAQDIALKDLTAEQIRSRPQAGLNSMAWVLWHHSRSEDIGVNVIVAECEQVWDERDWGAKLNVARRDLGSGMNYAEVDAFNAAVDVEALLAYREAVGRRTQAVVRELQLEVLAEPIDAAVIERLYAAGAFAPEAAFVARRWEGRAKEYTLMQTVLAHAFVHLGECEVLRGLLGMPTL
jgi:hypothetical protein